MKNKWQVTIVSIDNDSETFKLDIDDRRIINKFDFDSAPTQKVKIGQKLWLNFKSRNFSQEIYDVDFSKRSK